MPPATRKRARVPKPAVKVLSEDAIERPQEDRRGYRLVELANRMQVLLISDPAMDPELAPKMDDEDGEDDPWFEHLPYILEFSSPIDAVAILDRQVAAGGRRKHGEKELRRIVKVHAQGAASRAPSGCIW